MMRPVSMSLIATLLVVGACSAPDREADAEQVERAVRKLPAVSDTLLMYANGFNEGQRVKVTATIAPEARRAEVEQVRDKFAGELDDVELDDYDINLTVEAGRSRLDLQDFSTETIADDIVDDHVDRWVEARHVDEVRYVESSAYPASDGTDAPGLQENFNVTLPSGAGLQEIRATYRRLRRSVDGTSNIVWRVITGSKVVEFDHGLPSRAQIARIG